MSVFNAAMIADGVERADLQALSPEALERLAQYGNLLIKWNSRMNLTAIRDPSGILERHLVESIAAAQFLPEGIRTLLDFGSGAGLPGVPIAICRPGIAVTLAESQAKKAAFLAEVSRTVEVGLKLQAGRVDALPGSARFDVITLRAVDRMAEAVGEARGRVLPGGYLLFFVTDATRDGLLEVAKPISVAERSVSHGAMLLCRI